jgi:hypothetical protein
MAHIYKITDILLNKTNEEKLMVFAAQFSGLLENGHFV